MIIKPKSISVDIQAGVSTVPNSDSIGASLVSIVNTNTSNVLVALNPDNTNIYIAAGERVVIQKDPATQLDATSMGATHIWATAVAFTN